MTVSVTEAKEPKNRLTQLWTAVDKGERFTIERHGRIIAEIVKPSARKIPRFGTLKGIVHMTPEQSQEAARPMRFHPESSAFAGAPGNVTHGQPGFFQRNCDQGQQGVDTVDAGTH